MTVTTKKTAKSTQSTKLATTTIVTDKDIMVYSYSPTTNYSTFGNIQIMTSDTGSGDELYSLLNFPLTSLSGKTVKQALLWFYVQDCTTGNFIIGAKRITTTWSETVKYSTRPTIDTTSYNTPVATGTGWRYIDVTGLIVSAVGGSTYYGIWLYNTQLSYEWMQIADTTSAYDAYLAVTYIS